ncbi:MAG: type I glyceraldehyde-3-phosphate dehydrogenase [Pseudomonadota bacterium]
MTVRVAINGFGRIGRNILRAIVENNNSDVVCVGVNDLAPAETNAHLMRYDSVHGRFAGKVQLEGNMMDVGQGPIKVTSERDISSLPWAELGVDIALECTGAFNKRESAAKHLDAGAKRVLVSAPATGADLTVVYGVNHEQLTAEHKVVSNASCTTNCLAPVAKVMHEAFGIEQGHMTTIHAFTNDQNLLDVFHKDLRRARAATCSMIPTSTGAAKAVGLVLPELNGKFDGVAIRVPTQNVSLVDLTFKPSKSASLEAVNEVLRAAAAGPLNGILECCEEPLVSIDFNHHAASSTVDMLSTKCIEGALVRVPSWYDNEWGFSCRMIDTARHMAQL